MSVFPFVSAHHTRATTPGFRRNPSAVSMMFFSIIVFALFLGIPMIMILRESVSDGNTFSLSFFRSVFRDLNMPLILAHSFGVSLLSALITTSLAFVVSYTLNWTGLPRRLKTGFRMLVLLPMFLPTITYGFAIMYAFGKRGLITSILGGHQLFDIYGFQGIMAGFIVYTLPVAFVLINNTMQYIDPRYHIVSRILGDSPARSFYVSILRPLSGTLAASVIQCFFLCFTDYGIPVAIGGRYEVIATALYNQMLGAIPDFNRGSAVAITMLIPSCVSILLLMYMDRFNISYKNISTVTLSENRARDTIWGILTGLILLLVIGIFATVIVVPVVTGWPYNLTPTTEHFAEVFQDSALTGVYRNSLFTAFMTALFGTLLVYGTGLVSVRSLLGRRAKRIFGDIAMVSNTIPGMVLGIAYMLTFSGTMLQNTFFLIIICTIIHYYSTPFLMMKSSLEKMDPSWETTARLMGDRWIQTVYRVVTPNAISTLAEVFSYYFVNAMVTVSAVIFIVGSNTMLITTKIKELEHYQQFDDIFVLSILILITNLVVRGLTYIITAYVHRKKQEENTL